MAVSEAQSWPAPEAAGHPRIITAARHAFAAKGFAGASMRGIAAEAGVDAALIHHYFDSKQLFLATVALPWTAADARGRPPLETGAVSVSDSSEMSLEVWDSSSSRRSWRQSARPDRSGPDSIGR